MEIPKLTQEPIMNVDATPDDGYPLRILQAHRDNCNCRWESTPESFLWDQMNEDCEKRAVILDRAISILRGVKWNGFQ